MPATAHLPHQPQGRRPMDSAFQAAARQATGVAPKLSDSAEAGWGSRSTGVLVGADRAVRAKRRDAVGVLRAGFDPGGLDPSG